MNYKTSKAWIKHWNFIVFDLLCLLGAFFVAYWIRHGFSNPFIYSIYVNEVLVLILVQLTSAVFGDNFKHVLERGYYVEFSAALKQAVLVTLFGIFYLFIVKHSETYSRMTMLMTGTYYLLFSYACRVALKLILRKQYESREGKKSLMILTTEDRANQVVGDIKKQLSHEYKLCGLVLLDASRKGEKINDVLVVANVHDVVDYVCHSWVDALYIDVEEQKGLPKGMLNAFSKMGVTIHLKLQGVENPYHRKQYIERVAGATVMTVSVNDMSEEDLFAKRLMDVAGGLVGCLITLLLVLILGPLIFLASPGPIFFSQTRIGMNGKPFKIYKFRSMYMDAEERKKELMEQNDVADGLMFKMENDPRIIKGIGHFIRKTSLDEFPQFFNVLKGDMSLVGTRPPTVDEWEKYALHHRLRMSIRPGITGLWQVSGRSNITDFEEVVKLDAEYISKWNIGLDLKIIWKTVCVMWSGNNGAR